MKEIEDFKYRDNGKDSLINQRHFHNNCYEILHITSGTGVMMIRDKLYPLQSGSVFFINGTDAHCSIPEIPENYIRSKIIFSRKLINNVLTHADCTLWAETLFNTNSGVCVDFTPEQSAKLDALLLKLNENLKENTYDSKLKIILSILSIMNMAIESKARYIPPLKNKMSELLEYINKNIDKKLSLDELCSKLHISKYYLCRTFKKTMDMTIFEYILVTRLSKAKQMLSESDNTVSDIAMNCGFCSFAYFSKVFKEQENIFPLQYRKNTQII